MIVSKITEHKKEKPFPKLMVVRDKAYVVLFECEGEGTVLTKNGYWGIGHHSKEWAMSDFTDFSGSITLENAKQITKEQS